MESKAHFKQRMNNWHDATRKAIKERHDAGLLWYGGRAKKKIQGTLTEDDGGVTIRTFDSIADAARHFGVSRQNIHGSMNGVSKTACGYTWEYCN